MSALVAQPASFQSTLLRVSGFQDLEAFQSTLSMRRATTGERAERSPQYFNPRSP